MPLKRNAAAAKSETTLQKNISGSVTSLHRVTQTAHVCVTPTVCPPHNDTDATIVLTNMSEKTKHLTFANTRSRNMLQCRLNK